MLGKKFMYKRSVMIALAVVALMTLTAGVAAASSIKAKFDADGSVSNVEFVAGATVVSKFKYKGDSIKSIKIHTNGEKVNGNISTILNCGDECSMLEDALGGSVSSIHESKVTLKVTHQPGLHPLTPAVEDIENPLYFLRFLELEVVGGDLKGKLKAKLDVTADEGTLSGKANLKIRGTGTSYYVCLTVVGPGPIAYCASDEGVAAGAILAPTELHVEDTGNFKVENDFAKVTGKIKVKIDQPFPGAGILGSIDITKGKATFPID